MMYLRVFVAKCVVVFFMVLCATSLVVGEPTSSTKPWTFLVYMARDNSLSDYGTININAMKSAQNPNVNILVYDCSNISGNKMAQKLLITHNAITILETIPHADSGSVDTFINACTWAVTDFPSTNLAIVAWNHGSGMLNRLGLAHQYLMRGFCYDDTTGNYLDDIKLMYALDAIVKLRNGRKIDIFGFDACLMADVEMISALAPYASYVVASQETIPGDGWNYAGLLSWYNNQNITPIKFAGMIVSAYDTYYRNKTSYTLSAINTVVYATLNNAINSMAVALNMLLNAAQPDKARTAIMQSLNSYFEEPTYLDFYTFCTRLLASTSLMGGANTGVVQQLKTSLGTCINSLRSMIIANVRSRDRASATGLSIYFPQQFVENSYRDTFFGQTNAWTQFITSYIG
jgi:cysteine peptidase C11 family protein